MNMTDSVTASLNSKVPVSAARIAVIGGGLAGIAAAAELAKAGAKVSLLESRPELGGRATAYTDPETGEVIDNCQHVSMGCCTNLQALCETLGIADQFQIEKVLYFVGPTGTITSFSADPLPAPFHLTRSFARLPYLNWNEKRLFAKAVQALAKAVPSQLQGINFLEWLKQQRQSENLIRNVWETVLISALSESLERIDAAYARKVFVDGFLTNSHGWTVHIPRIDLNDLYSIRTKAALAKLGVDVRLQSRVRQIAISEQGLVTGVVHASGEHEAFEVVISTVAPWHVTKLLPEVASLQSIREQCQKIETAPITSVHLWYDRPITSLPHAVLLERMGQWLFNRGTRQWGEETVHAVQVVVSASRLFQGEDQDAVIRRLDGELRAIWPESQAAVLRHSRMITERRAVFSVTPGIDELRPVQTTPISNLFLAGDWTQTGWPSTMEGAVISGYLAAEFCLASFGENVQVLRDGLPVSWLSKALLGIGSSRPRVGSQ